MDQKEFLQEQVDIAISKLCIKDGDFVIVRMSDPSPEVAHDVAKSLSKAVQDSGMKEVTICFLNKADGISSLNPDEMAKLGWFRKGVPVT